MGMVEYFRIGGNLRFSDSIFPHSPTISSLCITAGANPGIGQGGPQVLRPKVADVAKWSHAREVSNLRPGSRARLRTLEAFGFLMLKYTFSHILGTLFL